MRRNRFVLPCLLLAGALSLGCSGSKSEPAKAQDAKAPPTTADTIPTLSPAAHAAVEAQVCDDDDECPAGYVCNYSWSCPKMAKCAPPVPGNCRKICTSDAECPPSRPACRETQLIRGDVAMRAPLCAAPSKPKTTPGGAPPAHIRMLDQMKAMLPIYLEHEADCTALAKALNAYFMAHGEALAAIKTEMDAYSPEAQEEAAKYAMTHGIQVIKQMSRVTAKCDEDPGFVEVMKQAEKP